MTLAAIIGKVTCKRTGREIRVITPSFKSDRAIKETLQEALDLSRKRKVTSIAIVLYEEESDEYYSNSWGDPDKIQAGTAMLSYRASKNWEGCEE